jgi:ribosomal protein S18 acetylase RimI-like enzyme
MNIRRLEPDDLPRLREFWVEHWGGDSMVIHGEIVHPEQLEGLAVQDGREWIGLVTFRIMGDDCEIISLDSVRERKGIGSALIEMVVEEARTKGCRRIFLDTTNDNLHALGFYQRRGFELVNIYCCAVNESRKIKPGIPLIGESGIPIRDEIELEMIL